MKMFKKFSAAVLIIVFAFVFGLVRPTAVFAADSPDLGMAESFAVLAGTAVTNVPTSKITGNVGLKPAAGSYYSGLTAAQVTGTIYAVDATGPAGSVVNPGALTTAKNDLTDAYTDLASDACGNGTVNGDEGNGVDPIVPGIDWTGTGVIDLAGKTLVPGVYCASAFKLTGVLTLDGDASDVYIFRSAATIITSPGSSVTGGGACNVWWRAVSSVTLDTTTTFKGNILALESITMNNGATLAGRALARNGAVTLDHNTITNATCSGASATLHATLHVIKDVDNDNGGDATADDFNLYVKSSGTDVAGSPADGVESPGRTYLLAAGTYVMSEDKVKNYEQSFGGNCNSSGSVTLANGDNKTCRIINSNEGDSESSRNEHEEETTPSLPNAGIGPEDQSGTPWNIIIPTEIFIALFSCYLLARKKLTI